MSVKIFCDVAGARAFFEEILDMEHYPSHCRKVERYFSEDESRDKLLNLYNFLRNTSDELAFDKHTASWPRE